MQKPTKIELDFSKYDLFIFDYFDTIVSRHVHPEMIKMQACEKISRIYNLSINGYSLYKIRSEIEASLCSRNKEQGFDLDFQLPECLEEIWSKLLLGKIVQKQKFIKLFIDIELSIECAMQFINNDVLNLIKELKIHKKKLIIISDFYIPKAYFQTFIKHHDLSSYFDELYVSSDHLLTKKSGRLYASVLNNLKNNNKIVMIGDNHDSDYNQALSYGISAYHIDRSHQHSIYAAQLAKCYEEKLIENNLKKYIANKSLKFPELALSLYTFIELLHNKLLDLGSKDVFFLAREGQWLKLLFDNYQETHNFLGDTFIKTHYLKVSRRSTFLPSLKPLEQENFEVLFRQYRKISVKEFLLNLGLEELIDYLVPIFGEKNILLRQEDLPTSDIFRDLINNDFFKEKYENCRKLQKQYFSTYLKSFLKSESSNTLYLVDVGWKGTIQDNIYSFINSESSNSFEYKNVYGLYVGLVASGNINPNNSKEGLLFSSIDKLTKDFYIFNENRSLFEVLLAANHGSAAKYIATQNYEFNSLVNPLLDPFHEEELYKDKIKPYQDSINNIFEKICNNLAKNFHSKNWLLSTTAKYHYRMNFGASSSEIEWFTSAYHVENFGVFEESSFKIDKSAKKIYNRFLFYKYIATTKSLDLGFWPWSICLQRGGHLAAYLYKRHRIKQNKAQNLTNKT